MLLSIALVLVIGLLLGWLCKRIKLPSLIGMLLTGIVLGPYVLNWLDPSLLAISADIRKIALIIILTRAGFSLDIKGLRKIGRPAVFMCFLPATFELLGVFLLGPKLLGLSLMESLLLGSVLAAVSPAVVVPRMVKLMEEGYGKKKSIPELILAGASVDDVYVIVLFSTFMEISQGGNVSIFRILNIPVSIAAGAALGFLIGRLLSAFFKKVHLRDTLKVIIILCISFGLVRLEDWLTFDFSFSALIAVMFIGISMQKYRPAVVKRLSLKYSKLWVVGEVFLFVLVGACVNVQYLTHVGFGAVIMIFAALLFRMLGVFLSLFSTKFNLKEKLFVMLSYTPKATVQAAIGSLPLAAGLACGDTVLTVAVLAIVITAPLGAFAIDLTYKKCLEKEQEMQ